MRAAIAWRTQSWAVPCWVSVVAFGLAWWPGGGAHGDVIVLRGGGQVEGKILPEPAGKDKVQVLLLRGRKPLVFEKARILEVIPKASPLDEYLVKKKTAPDTAKAQFELGSWCEQYKLNDLARLHYEATLAIDKSFEPAHKKLAHIFHDGYWVTRDELSAAQGLIKHKGRWVSPEEKAKIDHDDQVATTQANWVRTIKILRQAILTGSPDRRREAETQFMAIRDPDAVVPLTRVLGNDEPERRILLAQVLSGIAGKEASTALVKLVLAETTSEIRSIAYDKLKDRDDPVIVALLVKALGSSDCSIINRAAWALGNLNAVEVVPRLVPVLVTSEQRLIVASAASLNQAAAGGMAGTTGTPMAANGNGSALAVQTPPVISQGAVAYGMMSVPYGVQSGFGVSLGGAPQGDTRPDLHLATFTFRNVEVLAALQKLTGKDFGYDAGPWRNWVSREFNPRPRPDRRVPQP
jgi:hypothetical protein